MLHVRELTRGDGVVQLLLAAAAAEVSAAALTVNLWGRSWNQLTISFASIFISLFFSFPPFLSLSHTPFPIFSLFIFPHSSFSSICLSMKNIIPCCPNFSNLTFVASQVVKQIESVCTSMLYSGSTFWHYYLSPSEITVWGGEAWWSKDVLLLLLLGKEEEWGRGQVSYLAAVNSLFNYFFLVHLSHHC